MTSQSLKNLSLKQAALLFFAAFILRFTLFYCYTQHEGRYNQPDSNDYHIAALTIATGNGMHRPDTNQPMFWRTPGYPAYLSIFYSLFGLTHTGFSQNSPAQKASIIFQIILCSLMPILIFYLAQILTNSFLISIIAACLSVFNIGFILATNYLLTDALASILFILFLLFFFYVIKNNRTPYIIAAAASLALYTWLRPMGETIAIISALSLLIFSKNKLKNILIFSLCFFAAISPWYIRNYNLTGQLFFCPIHGPYLTVFSAPKIKSRIEGISIEKSHSILIHEGGMAAMEDMIKARSENSPYLVCAEKSALRVALPWILNHPFYFLYDWIQEVLKTTFDLHSYQLVALAKDKFRHDPLVEFLSDKIYECLFDSETPLTIRLISWLEFLLSVLLWFGLFGGIWQFLIKPLRNWKNLSNPEKLQANLWGCVVLISLVCVGLTGGFGYARLRLPIECLLIIGSLQFWAFAYARSSYPLKIKNYLSIS